MLRSVLVILLFAIAFSNHSAACDCFGPLNFCETLHDNNPDLVVLAVKKADQAHGMQVEILEVLKGAESRQQVLVWGDNGFLCRHYVSQWSVGDTVIFSLHLIGQFSALPQEDSTDYFISVCGTYFLHDAGGQVSGAINGLNTLLSYPSFKNALTSCVTAIAAPANPLSGLLLFPNPPSDAFVQLALPPEWIHPLQIRLFSSSGREMHATFTSREPGHVMLNTATLQPGIYLLKVAAGEQVISRKLMIR